MSTDGLMDVEVPVNGTVVVIDGDVYDVDREKAEYVLCTCRDGAHKEYDRTHNVSLGQAPHLVGVTTVKIVWTPKQA